ncbi:MAG: PQQ-dependent sugar dehydrogenase [Verrucomicrobiota bacterium]
MRILFLFALILPLPGQNLNEFNADSLEKMKVEKLYATLCASCHGKDLSGGLGPSFLDDEWKHGSSIEDITRNIAKGNPDFGMVAFESVLSADKIRSLVIFIQEKNTRALLEGVSYPKPTPGKITKTQHHSYKIETVVKSSRNLKMPWAIAFLPDGNKLLTEKPGELNLVSPSGKLTKIKNTPEVTAVGQGGMMEVAPHPDYKTNGWIYLGYSDGFKDGGTKSMTRYVRGRIKNNRWTDEELIWEADKTFYPTSGVHFGTRIVFKDGHIHFPVGERSGMMLAQDVSHPVGKTYRLKDDGSIPTDNPDFGPKALPGLFTIGHRNPQGLALHPETSQIWSTEHGPRGGDELNLIEPGKNYGWSNTSYGMNYNGSPMRGTVTHREGITQPVRYWVPSIAVCGLDFYSGSTFPNWNNDLFVGGLKHQSVTRIRLNGESITEEEIILKDIGRVRDVAHNPYNGLLYVVLNGPDSVVRLVPTDSE